MRIGDVHVVLTHRRRHKQSDKHQPRDDQRMRGGQLKDVLQEERVQLGDLTEHDQLADAPEAAVRELAARIEPAQIRPAARRELEHGALDFTTGR